MKKRVLIVDDVRFNTELLVALLKEQYETSTAHDGLQALKSALVEKPDVILLDICMPEFDGADVCEILKRDTTTKHIPIVFITAIDDKSTRDKCMDLGGFDYIVKPIKPSKVLSTVAQALLQTANCSTSWIPTSQRIRSVERTASYGRFATHES